MKGEALFHINGKPVIGLLFETIGLWSRLGTAVYEVADPHLMMELDELHTANLFAIISIHDDGFIRDLFLPLLNTRLIFLWWIVYKIIRQGFDFVKIK